MGSLDMMWLADWLRRNIRRDTPRAWSDKVSRCLCIVETSRAELEKRARYKEIMLPIEQTFKIHHVIDLLSLHRRRLILLKRRLEKLA